MIEVKFDDILKQNVDAIVNPANTHMLHGGGLALIIARAGGISLVRESQAQAPIATGEAIHSTAGNLPFKGVIHAVGPTWPEWHERHDLRSEPYWGKNRSADGADPDELLRRAHVSAIRVAAEHEYTSVAFPAVSCGVFRFPVDRAAPIAVRAVREAQERFPGVSRVVFCLLDQRHHAAFEAAAK